MMKTACIQMSSGPEILENLRVAEELIREAAQSGAEFVLTPENTCHIRSPMSAKLESAPLVEDHPAVPFFSRLAAELNIHLLIGSISVRDPDREMLWNRSLFFTPDGFLSATYNKIHLFDSVIDGVHRYMESDVFLPGEDAVSVRTPDIHLGMTICYDLRFAHLYRALAKAGAWVMSAPSAYTVQTGRAHWETLIRARAIETGSYILAPGQTGEHQGGRLTYGHSMIVGPWGNILAQAGEEEGFILADIDAGESERARESVPALANDRPFTLRQLEAEGS